ncbi:hypothetical protein R8Z50_15705 [Longispora sp. K20-0274]|uniref:hypothetical protein n=1 Tax=Longispora sp. K20-0274 TaxID=3088255 RepID=UPI00399BBDF7
MFLPWSPRTQSAAEVAALQAARDELADARAAAATAESDSSAASAAVPAAEAGVTSAPRRPRRRPGRARRGRPGPLSAPAPLGLRQLAPDNRLPRARELAVRLRAAEDALAAAEATLTAAREAERRPRRPARPPGEAEGRRRRGPGRRLLAIEPPVIATAPVLLCAVGGTPRISGLDERQAANAAIIVTVGRRLDAPERARVIAGGGGTPGVGAAQPPPIRCTRTPSRSPIRASGATTTRSACSSSGRRRDGAGSTS